MIVMNKTDFSELYRLLGIYKYNILSNMGNNNIDWFKEQLNDEIKAIDILLNSRLMVEKKEE